MGYGCLHGDVSALGSLGELLGLIHGDGGGFYVLVQRRWWWFNISGRTSRHVLVQKK